MDEWANSSLSINEDIVDIAPSSFNLKQNYPNPFNPSTNIEFEMMVQSDIKIEIFDVTGGYITTLYKGFADPGVHKLTWNGINDKGQIISSGVYFYKMTADNFVQTRKLLFAK